MTTTRARSTFVRDATAYVKGCAAEGAGWDEVWDKVAGGCAIYEIDLTGDEKMDLYDAWDGAFPWAKGEAAA